MSGADVFIEAETVQYSKVYGIIHASMHMASSVELSTFTTYG